MSFAPEWLFGEESCTGYVVTSNVLHLHGPMRCGKTSLMFQLALHFAHKGLRTVFLCNRSRLYASPPVLRKPLDAAARKSLSLITFKYIEKPDALCEYLLNIEASSAACQDDAEAQRCTLPALLVVDEFFTLFGDTGLSDFPIQHVFHTLALLSDTVRWLRTQRGASDTLAIVSNTTYSHSEALVASFHHPLWVSHHARILPNVEEISDLHTDDVHLSFQPTCIRADVAFPPMEFIAVYTISSHALVVKEFLLVDPEDPDDEISADRNMRNKDKKNSTGIKVEDEM